MMVMMNVESIETTRKCKEAGMNDILPKPMSTDTL